MHLLLVFCRFFKYVECGLKNFYFVMFYKMVTPDSLHFFQGTNVVEAKKILEESSLPIQSATDLDDAAIKAVASLR